MTHSRALTMYACLALSACQRGPAASADQAAVISDQVHSDGRDGFYWMPPLVEQPLLEGSFDASQKPIVEIFALDATGHPVGPPIAVFTTGSSKSDDCREEDDHEADDPGDCVERIRVQVEKKSYSVAWHTDRYNLDPAVNYRVIVYLGKQVAGFLDVDVVKTAKQAKNVDKSQVVALIKGRTLPIKFYLNGCALDCPAMDACHVAPKCDPVSLCPAVPPETAKLGCFDGDPCTFDSCDAATGCYHVANPTCGTFLAPDAVPGPTTAKRWMVAYGLTPGDNVTFKINGKVVATAVANENGNAAVQATPGLDVATNVSSSGPLALTAGKVPSSGPLDLPAEVVVNGKVRAQAQVEFTNVSGPALSFDMKESADVVLAPVDVQSLTVDPSTPTTVTASTYDSITFQASNSNGIVYLPIRGTYAGTSKIRFSYDIQGSGQLQVTALVNGQSVTQIASGKGDSSLQVPKGSSAVDTLSFTLQSPTGTTTATVSNVILERLTAQPGGTCSSPKTGSTCSTSDPCGPLLDTYFVEANDGRTGSGIRCIDPLTLHWYGEGSWGPYTYRYLARGLPPNGSHAVGFQGVDDTADLRVIGFPRTTLAVQSVDEGWNERWTYVPKGTDLPCCYTPVPWDGQHCGLAELVPFRPAGDRGLIDPNALRCALTRAVDPRGDAFADPPIPYVWLGARRLLGSPLDVTQFHFGWNSGPGGIYSFSASDLFCAGAACSTFENSISILPRSLADPRWVTGSGGPLIANGPSPWNSGLLGIGSGHDWTRDLGPSSNLPTPSPPCIADVCP